MGSDAAVKSEAEIAKLTAMLDMMQERLREKDERIEDMRDIRDRLMRQVERQTALLEDKRPVEATERTGLLGWLFGRRVA